MENNNSELYKALAKVQSELKSAELDSINPHFKAKYSTLASVWNACRKPLTDNGFCVIQKISRIHLSDNLVVETVLGHSSGQWESCSVPVLSQRQDMQGIGSAITYAKRYGLASMVGITSSDEDDDGNRAGTTDEGKANAATQTQKTNQALAVGDFVINFNFQNFKGKKIKELTFDELTTVFNWSVDKKLFLDFQDAVRKFRSKPKDPPDFNKDMGDLGDFDSFKS